MRGVCAYPHWVPNEQAVGSLLLPDTPLGFQIPHWVSVPLQQHLLSGPGLDHTDGCLGEKTGCIPGLRESGAWLRAARRGNGGAQRTRVRR